jgi:hypothetical protein
MPQTIQAEMRKIKVGMVDLFKTEINPITREFKSKAYDWEDWQAFEGAYEEAWHLLRVLVMNILKRDEKKMYDFRKISPRMQKAQSEQREELFTKQDIQKRLLKLKSKQEQFKEYQEEVQQCEGSE